MTVSPVDQRAFFATPSFVAPQLLIAAIAAVFAAVIYGGFWLYDRIEEALRQELRMALVDVREDLWKICRHSGMGSTSQESPDKTHIRELVQTLGESDLISLARNRAYMKRLGDLIDHIPPLQFLSFVFTDSDLTRGMSMIMNSGFKRKAFMDGLGARLTREKNAGTLDLFLADFVTDVGGTIKKEEVQKIFQSQDWDRLIYYLLENI